MKNFLILVLVQIIILSCSNPSKVNNEALLIIDQRREKVDLRIIEISSKLKDDTLVHSSIQNQLFSNIKNDISKFQKTWLQKSQEIIALKNGLIPVENDKIKALNSELLRAEMLVNLWDNKLKLPKHYEKLLNESILIGKWTVNIKPLNKSYIYEIFKDKSNFTGVYAQIDDFNFKTESLKKSGNKYFVINSEFGEYYKIDSNNNMELFDNEGSLKTAGYEAVLNK